MSLRGELSLSLRMVHRRSDFPCEWFTAEVTSPCDWFTAEVTSAANSSPRKFFLAVKGSLQDFDKKNKCHFRCEWFTAEVTSAANGSPRK